MAWLIDKADVEEKIKNLQKQLDLMPPDSLMCDKCYAIYEKSAHRCYCDYESDRY